MKSANKSCEHLELRLEESETELKELRIRNTKQTATVQMKTRIIDDLQSLLETLESDNLQLKENLKSTSQHSSTNVTPTSPSHLERSSSYRECGQRSSTTKELLEIIDDLTSKLSDTQYQRSRIKQTAESISSENKKLREMLLKAESEVIELQTQMKFMDEVNNDKSEPATPIPPQSPGRRSFSNSFMSNPGSNMCLHCNGETNNDDSFSSSMLSVMKNDNMAAGSDTLFTELQNELDTLQIRFDKLQQDCTCSASIPYKGIVLDTPPPCGEDTKDQNDKVQKETTFETDNKLRESSLKDLFDEVYASLMKSSCVADQLLAKQKSARE